MKLLFPLYVLLLSQLPGCSCPVAFLDFALPPTPPCAPEEEMPLNHCPHTRARSSVPSPALSVPPGRQ